MSIVKTNVPGYVKDEKTNVVINTNVGEFELYKLQREKALRDKNNQDEVQQLKQTVNSIHNELSELKQLLLLAIEKK